MRFSASIAAMAAAAGSARACDAHSNAAGSSNGASRSSAANVAKVADSGDSGSTTTTQATSASTKSAANSGIQGFNYGAFYLNNQALVQSDFEYEFNRAKNLPGAEDQWTSARLYTMIQSGTTNTVVSAIPAAIATNTSLLLGLWVSGGSQAITNELAALKTAIDQYGTDFTDLVVGLSVGSEDLYRDANPTDGVGLDSATLIEYITKTKNAIAGTTLEGTPVGHVDTYDSFLNSSNSAVIDAIDWLGFDGYPYWESSNGNSIADASELFYSGLNKTKTLAGGKPVYVTETGWPADGENFGEAVASPANARIYWEDIACRLVSEGVNVWWYILQESQYGTANPDFGLYPAGDLATVDPYYKFTC